MKNVLKMANTCYMCGNEMTEGTDCCPHYEHIIPNALGGHLTSNTILCKKCGTDYSRGDRRFVDIFGSFIHNLESLMRFDRKHDGVQVSGHYYDGAEKIDIIADRNGAAPRRPIVKEESDHVKIMANSIVAKQLLKKYEKEGRNVEMVENLYGPLMLHFSEGNKDFNSQFKEGMVKIAVEYALYKRIDRNQLDAALFINEDNSASVNYDSIAVFPFVSMDVFNDVFETHRKILEKNYPSHTLLLFNDNRRLFCFIDLFSTFQYYVLLSENYEGADVQECYYQPLFSQRQSCKYSKEELGGMSMSDLHIVLGELGMDCKDKTIETLVNEAVDLSNKSQTERSYDDIRMLIPSLPQVMSCYIEDCFPDEDDAEVDPNVVEEMVENGNPESYKKIAFRKRNEKMEHYSYPLQCNRLAGEEPDEVKKYTHMKYMQLQNFSNGVHIEEQIKKYSKEI